ncbi:IclR family transcriptional regulator [Dactylosporangium matsuzakiense]|uniref:Glycerol operon regulatory protein n=1 Tax=Dactylosporangium matsuzakiense TaxID=53360 RepID=A0A9W6NQF7_9ACTN|nr:IclR family transcriptional regulator [Dactylosporangium matsuzakiense]UWZ48358.1 IclR family transcriptional regulator [Dactylosporangium matsuzakiense]GLL05489.1 IclR family transcriptional regulator [Dactylosporangium matsuzakiense]
MAADVGSNQSVERALTVLRVFTAGRAELRVSDVAKLADLGLSTASRLLATLEAAGFVDRDPVSGLYRLGLDTVSLGGSVLNAHPVHREARQTAQNLAAEVGLGVNVAVRRDGTLFYLLNFEGRLAPRSFVLTGQRNPLHATGLGKSLLTGLSAAERRALLPADALVGYTPNTVTTHEQLDAEIERTLRRGYGTEIEELALGRACVATPIRDGSGAVVAALSVSGPLSAIDLPQREADLSRRVIEAADSISIGLGYVGPAHHISLEAAR